MRRHSFDCLAVDIGLDGVIESAWFTVDPFIEEIVKIAPLSVASWWLHSKSQRGVTDFVLIASGFGAGFGLFEAFARYGQLLSKFTTFPGGYVRPNSLFPLFMPNLNGILSSWIPTSAENVDLSATGDAPHVVWSSIPSLGIGLFFKAKTPIRIVGLLLVVTVSVDHAAGNYRAAEPLLDIGFYDTYGTSLTTPFTGISSATQSCH